MNSKYKEDQPVWYPKAQKKAVIKEFLPSGLFRITYFNKQDKREIADVLPDDIQEYKKPTGNKYYYMTQEFHKAFGHPYSNIPREIDAEHTLNRASWVVEEMIEWLHATAKDQQEFTNMYDQLVVRGYTTYLKHIDKEKPSNTLVAQIDALIDALYFINGGFVHAGVKPDKPFKIVHEANMQKLWDGKPKYNDEGKVIKPPTWQNPEPLIEKEIEDQMKRK